MKHLLLSIITILLLSVTQASANYLVRINGDLQTAQAGEKFEEPIKIRVQKSETDTTPVPNIAVNFTLQKGVWIDFETNPIIASLDLTTDENGEAGVVLTAGNIDEDVYRVRYAIRVTIIGDTRSVFFQLAVTGFNAQEPPINFDPPTDDPDPDPPTDDPDPDPPTDDPDPDPPTDDPKPDPPTDDPKPDPPTDDPPRNPTPMDNPDPPRNPTPTDDPKPDPPPVLGRAQMPDPNEIWHVMYRNDNGQATVFVYPRCFNNPYHNPPKPACENDYGITEELFFQVSPDFAIELQGNSADVNYLLDSKLAEDNASLGHVGGVQGIVN